jgi:hypothetical protein
MPGAMLCRVVCLQIRLQTFFTCARFTRQSGRTHRGAPRPLLTQSGRSPGLSRFLFRDLMLLLNLRGRSNVGGAEADTDMSVAFAIIAAWREVQTVS